MKSIGIKNKKKNLARDRQKLIKNKQRQQTKANLINFIGTFIGILLSPISGIKNFLSRRKEQSKLERDTFGKTDQPSLLRRIHGNPDLQILFLVVLMLIGGLIMIFSSSAYYAVTKYDDIFYFFSRQILFIIVGGITGYIFFLLPIESIKKISPILLAVGIVMLIYILPEALFGKTFVDVNNNVITQGIQMPFVDALNGAPRWINLPMINIQPSELVKFAFVIYISAWLTKPERLSRKTGSKKNEDHVREHIREVVMPFMILLGLISAMILAQRDFDTTVIMALSILTVYYLSGQDRLHSIGSIFIIISSFIFGFLAMIIEPYRRSRLESWFHIFLYGEPSSRESAAGGAFQVWNGLTGFGSGGFWGNGYGDSVIKQGYIQEAAYTDSIFAVIGDEFGFIGSLLIIIAFLYFAALGFDIARKAKDKFSALTAAGLTALITIQAFLNIAAVQSLIPFGGMPLPFFTYGGSTTIVTLMCIGVLLNISKQKGEIKDIVIDRREF